MPTVAIVGRPNVGKSSLLNALVGKRISIVQDMPGVTRDRIGMPLEIDGRWIELIDTGGYGFVDPDQLTEHIKHQIELAMASANLVLFLVDCQAGLTGGDEQIATLLRRQGIKTVLVANKADGPTADVALGDFARLGLGTPIGVSALRERNLDQVIAALRSNLDLSKAPREIPEPQMMLAIVGKRNAGKSTLVNSIASAYGEQGDRVIVSEVPGTTRDSIDVRFEKDGKKLIVIDTAGVRKKRHIATNDIEFYSFHRAQRSVRRADVVLLLIDGIEPVSEPDKKLAQYIAEQFKPCMLVVNKWDKVREQAAEQAISGKQKRALARAEQEGDETAQLLHQAPKHIDDKALMEEYRKYLDTELGHLDYAPIAFITAKDGKNVQGVLDEAQRLFKQATTRLTTGQLNRVVRQILEEKTPSTPSGRKARIYYATQTSVSPPTIVLFVNNPIFLNDSYQRFMINRFREMLPFAEVPIHLLVRGRDHKAPTVSLDEISDERLEEFEPTGKPIRKSAPGKVKSGGIIRAQRNGKTKGKRPAKNPGRGGARRR